jgi:hypothetical protein
VESATKDLLNEVQGTSDLQSLLPEYPEISTKINYNQELTKLEKGCHHIKDDILSTHNELEGIFNDYDVLDSDQPSASNTAEDKLDQDISQLLKSKFFNKQQKPVAEQALELETDDVQDELAATLGGVYSNVEKGVGAEMTEATEANDDDDDDASEGSLTTEAATSESASTTQASSGTVESAATPLPEISSPEAAPDTVVAAEGTTGVEAKLPEAIAAAAEEGSGFLQGTPEPTA